MAVLALVAVLAFTGAALAQDEPIGEGTVINTERLKIREQPKKAAALLGEVYEGDVVEVLEVLGGKAALIRTADGIEGWVPAKYLEIRDYPADGPEPEPEPEPEPVEATDPVTGETAGEVARGELETMYIVPLEVAEDVEPSIGAAVQGAIYEGFDKRKLFRMMTRDDIIAELGSGGATLFFGCKDKVDCLSRFAGDIGLKKIFTGKLSYGRGGFLTLRLNEVDPAIGAIKNSARADLDEEGDLFAGVDEGLTKLLGVGEDGTKTFDLGGELSLAVSEDGSDVSEPEAEDPPADADGVLRVKKKFEKKEKMSSAWAFIVLGAGVAVAATGSAFYFMANSNADLYESTSFQRKDSRFHEELQDTIERQALVGNILVPVGGAIAASSAVLFYFAFAGDDEEEKDDGKLGGGITRAAAPSNLRVLAGPAGRDGLLVGASWDF